MMKPEDIRRLYNQEDAATEEEAQQTKQDMRSDPGTARAALLTLYSLAGEDPAFAHLLGMILRPAMMQILVREVEKDDAFALKIGDLIATVMEQTQPKRRTPRGKPRTNKAA